MTPGDWRVVWFYQLVRDQIENLSPMGLEGGGMWLAPRVDAWLRIARAAGVAASQRFEIVQDARHLHECVEKRVKEPGLFMLPAEMLMPPVLLD